MEEATRTLDDLPGLPALPFLGSWVDAMRDPLALFSRAAGVSDLVTLRFGPYRYLLLHDPAAIHHVLVTNAHGYVKSPSYRGLKLVVGNGLLTSEGDRWRRQRKLAQPAFHREHLSGFADTMARDTADLVAEWRTAGDGPLDVHKEMMRLTFRIVGHTLFSTELSGDAAPIAQALVVILKHVNDQSLAPVPTPLWFPSLENLRFKKALAIVDGVMSRIVAERRAMGERAPRDLLSMLLAARDEETGEGMDDRQLRDEIITLALAGHETTANALAWSFSLLARHPDVCRAVAAEARAVLGDRSPTLADLPHLTLARRVIEESLRLYPPAWAFERMAIADDVVAGVDVPKGTIVGICPYTLHRDPRFFPDPEVFDPDRFLPTNVAARPRYAYLPFGAGPRICIGMSFALMESQLILAMLARDFRLELAPRVRLRLDPAVTLRPRDGLPMVRKRRDTLPPEKSSESMRISPQPRISAATP